jgi:hypothetical protein
MGITGPTGPQQAVGTLNYAQTVGTRITGLPSNSTLYSVVVVSITTTGNPVQITAYGDVNASSAAFNGQLAIYRDGSGTAGNTYTAGTQLGNLVFYESSTGNENQAYCLAVIDTTVTAGTHTYTLVSYNRSAASGTFDFGESQGPVISAVELASAQGPTGPAGSGIIQSDYVVLGVLSGNQSIASAGSNKTVQFVDQYDPQGWYNASTYRFQPTIAGYYLITYEAWWETAASVNQFNIQIADQSGNQIVINQIPSSTVSGSSHTVARIHYMNGSTDYVYFTAFNGTSGAVNLLQGGTSYGAGGTFFTAFLIPAGGLTGPTGPAGPTGATGPTGRTGPTGAAFTSFQVALGSPTLTSPTSVILNAGGDAIATSEFLDSTPEGLYFQASTSVLPTLGDLVSLGISSTGGGTYSHFFEISDAGYQVWSEGSALGSVTAFTSPAIFSMYSDSAVIYFMVDGVTVQSNRITASSYQAFVSGPTLTTPPHSVTNIRFYPTGKVGATGPTGVTGPCCTGPTGPTGPAGGAFAYYEVSSGYINYGGWYNDPCPLTYVAGGLTHTYTATGVLGGFTPGYYKFTVTSGGTLCDFTDSGVWVDYYDNTNTFINSSPCTQSTTCNGSSVVAVRNMPTGYYVQIMFRAGSYIDLTSFPNRVTVLVEPLL